MVSLFVISSSKIISKKGFCFTIVPELLTAIVVGPFWILEPCQVHCALCLHSRLSIAVVSIQPTPTQSASSHAMLQCLKKLPLHLVVLLHEGAVVVVVVVVVVVTALTVKLREANEGRLAKPRGVKKSG